MRADHGTTRELVNIHHHAVTDLFLVTRTRGIYPQRLPGLQSSPPGASPRCVPWPGGSCPVDPCTPARPALPLGHTVEAVLCESIPLPCSFNTTTVGFQYCVSLVFHGEKTSLPSA